MSGQLILKRGINLVDGSSTLNFILELLKHPHVYIALSIQGIGYILWFYVLRISNLNVAFALSGAFFYVLMGLLGWLFLGEKLTGIQWIGIILITVGVMCITLNSSSSASL